jgi:hypothetical protein
MSDKLYVHATETELKDVSLPALPIVDITAEVKALCTADKVKQASFFDTAHHTMAPQMRVSVDGKDHVIQMIVVFLYERWSCSLPMILKDVNAHETARAQALASFAGKLDQTLNTVNVYGHLGDKAVYELELAMTGARREFLIAAPIAIAFDDVEKFKALFCVNHFDESGVPLVAGALPSTVTVAEIITAHAMKSPCQVFVVHEGRQYTVDVHERVVDWGPTGDCL